MFLVVSSFCAFCKRTARVSVCNEAQEDWRHLQARWQAEGCPRAGHDGPHLRTCIRSVVRDFMRPGMAEPEGRREVGRLAACWQRVRADWRLRGGAGAP